MRNYIKKKIGNGFVRGIVDFIYNRKGYAIGFGGPLNGQKVRQDIISDIVKLGDIKAVIETGTFRATSSIFLNQISNKTVYTCENHPRFFIYSKLQTLFNRGIKVFYQDSRSFLEKLSNNEKITNSATLIYLDAHWWEDDLPLHSELKIIIQNFTNPVIVIDDFQVPRDNGYGYDNYGKYGPLSLDLIKDLLTGINVYFPISSELETGAKRGCVVLTRDIDLSDSKNLVHQLMS